ncbi:hypothetical protein PG993_008016 [Apiospora rasikravindrae]|uniref:Uncharacterized protein n=1 Tax=Apiospora rasikravindrae TaxID=990691 RepID=A0ABR1T0X2_9PEZI
MKIKPAGAEPQKLYNPYTTPYTAIGQTANSKKPCLPLESRSSRTLITLVHPYQVPRHHIPDQTPDAIPDVSKKPAAVIGPEPSMVTCAKTSDIFEKPGITNIVNQYCTMNHCKQTYRPYGLHQPTHKTVLSLGTLVTCEKGRSYDRSGWSAPPPSWGRRSSGGDGQN